ncbi:Stage VI sporulation protein F [Alteribacillus persepolensis]|uniref:Stage VI sporulation protein F n=1 Tax=Alteribacillus persepolensis TaxID=568899 RepID=A0A1G7ZGX8_9BACI|nr:stage VI sporulation protein F [Alteribacillus persepolensis]SDH08041.1 Stage VI sporulation protein F [Alteribacillus persepolensis]
MRHRQNDSFFDQIEKKTNVKQEDLFKLVQSLNGADFQDEQTVRRVISDVSRLAGKSVSKKQEDELVKAIVNNNIPFDLSSLNKWFQSR